MRTYKIFIALLTFAMLSSCGEEEVVSNEIVYVNNAKVFGEFEMKKDYDLKIESDLKTDALYLDSLAVKIKNAGLDTMGLYRARTDYYVAKQTYDRKFEELSTQYTNEVNSRLNKYMKKFAEKNGYEMIISSQGNGTMMYVSDRVDVTDKLIKFINKKYQK